METALYLQNQRVEVVPAADASRIHLDCIGEDSSILHATTRNEQSALHTRCTLPTPLHQAMMLRTVLAAALLHTTHALAPPAQALRTLAKTSGDDVRGITSPEAENALLPESAYFVGLGFRAWLGD